MIELNNVTLCIVDCQNYGKAATAIQKSLTQIKPAKTIFLTDVNLVLAGIEVIKIPTIKSKRSYSNFVIKELHKYFDTMFILLIQHDGYVISGDAWTDLFYGFDFIGAPWLYNDGRNVGNGGVSLRSRKLQHALGNDPFIQVSDPEDECIGRLYRGYLEKEYEIKFPPEELADRFSFELRTPIQETFAFHGYFHKPFQKTIVINRQAALGDVVMIEPVLEYFFNKGYRVVLDTLPQFKALFANHYFKVHFPEELDPRLLDSVQTFNLNGSYEATPKMLHLQSYYNFCGIKDGIIKNPKLSVGFNAQEPQYKLFNKFCVVHYDKRGQGGRNIYGLDWSQIVSFLTISGYVIIQIGKGEHEKLDGVIEMNLVNEMLLTYAIASADLFIGCDSGPSNIAVSFNIPAVIFFGAVESKYIYADHSNICVIDNGVSCEKPKCWHEIEGGTSGMKCIVDESMPPCATFDTASAIMRIDKFINK